MLDVRDKAKALLVPSSRGNVPPFMVMDVMAAAARIEAAGGNVIHMEVGQPAAPAPRTAIAAARAALDVGRSTIRRPSAFRRCDSGFRDTTVKPTGRRWIRPHRDHHRLIWRVVLAFLSAFEPGDRVAITSPGYPPYRHPARSAASRC
jgi:hypothetical protein